MEITLENKKISQVKTKVGQFKKLIDFDDFNQTIKGRTILDSILYKENVLINQLIVEMYNKKIAKFKGMVYLNLSVYEK